MKNNIKTRRQRVFVAGHNGMVGSALCRKIETSPREFELIAASRAELDLRNQAAVNNYFNMNRPDIVYLAAAKVGGIYANSTYPYDFILDNILIQSNIIEAARIYDVEKLLFLGSSCIYPKNSKQPMVESELLSGYLEPTNEPYAIAKVSGLIMCDASNRQYGTDFRSIMPTSLYGVGDNFDSMNSHVIPGMLRRFHEAKIKSYESVEVWGTGHARREFLYVDDLADAAMLIMDLDKDTYLNVLGEDTHINIGSGSDISISDLAEKIANIVGFSGNITYDKSRPDGPMQKLLCNNKLQRLLWKPSIGIDEGLELSYKYLKSIYSELYDEK